MKHDYEIDELAQEMDLLKNTFDIVRLIDIVKQRQCVFAPDSFQMEYRKYKYGFMHPEDYDTHQLMLRKVLQNKTTYTQFKFFKGEMYYIVAKYIRLGNLNFVLELISRKKISEQKDHEKYKEEMKELCDYKRIKIERKRLRKKESEEDHTSELKKLANSIENNEFYLLYQPKIENSSRRVIGLEALIRWKQNIVLNSAENFITSFEENNVIHLIDYFVLKEVVNQIKKWEQQNKKIIPISINMCCSTLLREDFFTRVSQIIENNTFADKIEIEITERNIPLNRVKELSIIVEKLKRVGFRIALDDFGANSANFPLIFELNLNTLKIDKSMVVKIEENIKMQKVLKDIFSTCKAFKIEVIVEGIEEKGQLDVLTKIGSELSQGYYFSKPAALSTIKEKY